MGQAQRNCEWPNKLTPIIQKSKELPSSYFKKCRAFCTAKLRSCATPREFSQLSLHLSQKLCWQHGIITASLKIELQREHLSSAGKSTFIIVGVLVSTSLQNSMFTTKDRGDIKNLKYIKMNKMRQWKMLQKHHLFSSSFHFWRRQIHFLILKKKYTHTHTLTHGTGRKYYVLLNSHSNFIKKRRYRIILFQLMFLSILLLWLISFAFNMILFITMPSEDPCYRKQNREKYSGANYAFDHMLEGGFTKKNHRHEFHLSK